ncbi:hypothetical protein BH10BAC5_BH10BAC5_07730 [soil metagenome]
MQPNRLAPVVISTVIMVLVSVMPFLNMLCCIGIPLGGFLGVSNFFKQTQNLNTKFEIKDGVLIGVFSGVLAGIIVAGVNLMFTLFTHVNPINEMLDLFSQMKLNIDPGVENYMQKLSAEYNDKGFSPTLTIFQLLTNLIFYPLFGMIGAVIGVSIFSKRIKRPTL